MKKLFKISEFKPLYLSVDQIDEEVLFDGVKQESANLTLISLAPLSYGFWRDNTERKESISEITFVKNQHTTLSIRGKELFQIPFEDESIAVWQPQEINFRHLTFIERLLEIRLIHQQSKRSKFKFSLADIRYLSASYFYPRKIYVVIVESDFYLNIFPMDLHFKSPLSKKYAFSLQTTNEASEILRKTKKVVIGEIGSDHLEKAYRLGKNHGRTNLFGKTLDFKTYRSMKYQIQVPRFCHAYREVHITKDHDLNTHTLFMGIIENEKSMGKLGKQPYHVHRFYFNFCKRNALASGLQIL